LRPFHKTPKTVRDRWGTLYERLYGGLWNIKTGALPLNSKKKDWEIDKLFLNISCLHSSHN
jgi:hypothetical protein